jgi:hypothetical protein
MSCICVTCPAYLIFLELIVLTLFGNEFSCEAPHCGIFILFTYSVSQLANQRSRDNVSSSFVTDCRAVAFLRYLLTCMHTITANCKGLKLLFFSPLTHEGDKNNV